MLHLQGHGHSQHQRLLRRHPLRVQSYQPTFHSQHSVGDPKPRCCRCCGIPAERRTYWSRFGGLRSWSAVTLAEKL